MTPKRQKWWLGLPEAEYKARLTIKMYETDIKIIKLNLKYTCDDTTIKFFKNELRIDKDRIKNLRKGMALNLTADGRCPACGQRYSFSRRTLKKYSACPNCGQHTLSTFYNEDIGGYVDNTKAALGKVKLC